MSELIDNSRQRKDLLKHLILELHGGTAPESVRGQLIRLLGQVPYGDVVEVEQELIAEGLPEEEVLRMCDVHAAALRGQIDLTGVKEAPAGHPVDTFKQENRALEALLKEALEACEEIALMPGSAAIKTNLAKLAPLFGKLWEVDKHYRRKEYLLFPHLEKKGITGPPTVMWGKHDQTRALITGATDTLAAAMDVEGDEAAALVELAFVPALNAVSDMIMKEEQILLPMCMDQLSDGEWFEIAEQSPEIGFCLIDPQQRWLPVLDEREESVPFQKGRVVMPTGSLAIEELAAMLNTLPVDLTFVDKDDTVRYFSHGAERIFYRDRSILGRKVQLCHPPHSVHIVNKIVSDFRSGAQHKAEFWITMQGKFIYISYYTVRGDNGEYLGTVELTMNLTHLRSIEGERRLLNYDDPITTTPAEAAHV